VSAIGTWLDRLFYPPCVVCGARGRGALCQGCSEDLPHNLRACPRCALPMPWPGHCPACLRRPPFYFSCMAPFVYEFPINSLVLQLKSGSRLYLARNFGEWLAKAARARDAALPQALVPVPLHHRRLRHRGFNQSLEICRWLRDDLSIPIDPCGLKRRPGRPQQGLTAGERRANARNAFLLPGGRLPEYRHVAIVVDVVTTGSTVNELAGTLRRGGIGRIDVWTLARAAAM